MRIRLFFLLASIALSKPALAEKFDCSDMPLEPNSPQTFTLSPTGDFAQRDTFPRTELPPHEWHSCCGKWGPCASPYPKVTFPAGANDLEWSRIRVIAAAKKFIGVPYAHYHIPEMGGLDCSNFTALVYNYAFGIRFSSNIGKQAEEAGRLLPPHEPLKPGDLIFLYEHDGIRISHVAIYVDEEWVIDATGTEIKLRPYQGRYKEEFARARRVLD